MASSKFPIYEVLVPEAIITYASTHPGVLCNLRPSQDDEIKELVRRREEHDREAYLELLVRGMDSDFLLRPIVREALKAISCPQWIVLHFQGYGARDVGTAVVCLDQIVYFGDGGPRLDFEHPRKMQQIHGCPNFWAGFILAFARIEPQEVFCEKDPRGLKFVRLCETYLQNKEEGHGIEECASTKSAQ